MKHFLLIILIMPGFCMLPQFCQAFDQPDAPAVAHKGVLDLRQTSLDNMPVALHGEWEFYWNELIGPGDTAKNQRAFIPYPSLWRDNQVNGHAYPSQGYASYALTILLPKHRPRLALRAVAF